MPWSELRVVLFLFTLKHRFLTQPPPSPYTYLLRILVCTSLPPETDLFGLSWERLPSVPLVCSGPSATSHSLDQSMPPPVFRSYPIRPIWIILRTILTCYVPTYVFGFSLLGNLFSKSPRTNFKQVPVFEIVIEHLSPYVPTITM